MCEDLLQELRGQAGDARHHPPPPLGLLHHGHLLPPLLGLHRHLDHLSEMLEHEFLEDWVVGVCSLELPLHPRALLLLLGLLDVGGEGQGAARRGRGLAQEVGGAGGRR